MTTVNNDAADGSKKSKSVWIKVVIIVLIVAAISGVYWVKTDSQNAETDDEAAFLLDATEDFDLDEILSYGLPVMIDFGSDSCKPCQQMAPVLEELNEQLQGKAIIKFVDVWENADAAKDMPIRVIPTQFFFDKDGKPYVPSGSTDGFLLCQDKTTEEHLFTVHEGGLEKDEILAVLEEMGMQ